MAGEHAHSLVLDERLALVAIPTDEGGRALVRYVADEETTEPEADDRSIREALALAGAWSDLDWDEMERELDRIGHEAPPTPPIDEP
ncbi:MAG TPA: hypothetical protein VFL91_31435 [Thermomicrobiales bacterium]|nr:hypothetical protein [Thermomicrobiales bacterium]